MWHSFTKRIPDEKEWIHINYIDGNGEQRVVASVGGHYHELFPSFDRAFWKDTYTNSLDGYPLSFTNREIGKYAQWRSFLIDPSNVYIGWASEPNQMSQTPDCDELLLTCASEQNPPESDFVCYAVFFWYGDWKDALKNWQNRNLD